MVKHAAAIAASEASVYGYRSMQAAAFAHTLTRPSFSSRLLPAHKQPALFDSKYWIWCGSPIVGDDGRFHLFASRWPKNVPFFEGYIQYSEVIHADADHPEGPYEFREVVLPDRGEQYWDGRMTHNPTVIRYKDRFLLFYIGTTFAGKRLTGDELRNIMDNPEFQQKIYEEAYGGIRIGMAESKSVYGPWTRSDKPILSPRKGHWDSKIVTNPAPCVTPDGSLYLYYRSNAPAPDFGCRLGVTHAIIGSDGKLSFIRMFEDPILQQSNGDTFEDPFVWHNGEYFELLAKEFSGKYTGEIQAGIHAWSDDGIHWSVDPQAMAYSHQVKWDDGTHTRLGCIERPQLLFQNGRPTHLFTAVSDGPGGFQSAPNTWSMVSPLNS